MQKPLIITMGDPTGIGPEIIVKALLAGELDQSVCPLLIVGDGAVLQRAAAVFEAEAFISTDSLSVNGKTISFKQLTTLPASTLQYGQPDQACGQAMATYIDWAADQCLSGQAAGMVTAPINKKAINAAGIHFPGHTEMLAARCDVEKPMMILCTKTIRVALITIHIGIADVPGALSQEHIIERIKTFNHSLMHDYAVADPKIAVLGLNPHAGENGSMGLEDEDFVAPSIMP